MRLSLLFLFLCCPTALSGQIISTIAGTGNPAFSGDGSTATLAEFNLPAYIAFDRFDNLYVTDALNRRVRKINSDGIVTTIAGNGTNAHTGDGGSATLAGLYAPNGVAIDTSGCIYISEAGHYIRKINTSGIITTIAGTGVAGYNGDGIPAVDAQLFYPYLGGVDAEGNIYFSDYGNHRIRKIDANGIITTIAGNGTNGDNGDGGPATLAQIKTPVYLTLHPSGDLFIPDNTAHKIRKVSNATGIITTFAGNGTMGTGGDGGPATNAQLSFVNSISFDNSGNAYIADRDANTIRKINTSGIITKVAGIGTAGFAGDGGPALNAKFNWPNTVAVNSVGNVFVADYNNHRIRKITFTPDAVQCVNTPPAYVGIYPMPAHDKITVTTKATILSIRVINTLGQEVLASPVYGYKEEVSINIGHLPAGIYVVQINGVYAERFVKE